MKRLTILALMFLLPLLVPAQDRIIPRSTLAVSFDLARFAHTDSSSYVEMYFACFPPLVTLGRTSTGFQGFLEIQTQIKNTKTGEYAVRNRSLLTVSVRDSVDPAYHNTLVTQMGYILPKGEYELSVIGIDTLDQSRRDSLSMPLMSEGSGTGVAISDVELCSKIEQTQTTTGMFYKTGPDVFPNPTLLFGTANYPVVFHYSELYGLKPSDTYIVKVVVADASGKPLQESSRKKKYGVQNAVEVGTTNVVKLQSGKYRYQLYLLSESSEPLSRTEKSFFVYNPQVAGPQVSSARMKETELSGLTSEELDQEFAYVRYHATDPEIKLYSQLTSAEGKREYLAAFWTIVEQGKMGREPVARQEYLSRVKQASDRFRAFNREGWRTDRGRIYILYSEPDEIERKPSTESGKPYEIWHYYQIENGIEFVFVDRTGFGEYLLVHSTKRGELRDDGWRRLLQ